MGRARLRAVIAGVCLVATGALMSCTAPPSTPEEATARAKNAWASGDMETYCQMHVRIRDDHVTLDRFEDWSAEQQENCLKPPGSLPVDERLKEAYGSARPDEFVTHEVQDGFTFVVHTEERWMSADVVELDGQYYLVMNPSLLPY